MPRGGGGAGERGCRLQDHPPATGHRCRDVPRKQPPAASLPDDVLVEILSRVPYRSLCRFRCVSRPWLALCSDPDVRRRSPQTLSGFFYDGSEPGLHFRNLSGRGAPLVNPSLPFLRTSYECFMLEPCCSGLLLLKCWESCSEEDEYDYVVCNPATEEWTVLPLIELPNQDNDDVLLLDFDPYDHILGFDAAVPSCFVVFAPLSNCYGEFTEVAIYSSETGRWTFVQSEWYYKTILVGNSECVVLNGTMHLTTHYSSIVTVDMEWKAWREIELPDDMAGGHDYASIGQSQGRLYAWHIDNYNDCQLSVSVLEDYVSGQWTLKHAVNFLELFGRDYRKADESYTMFAIHLDCNLIFLTDGKEKTVSYDMDNYKVHVTALLENSWTVYLMFPVLWSGRQMVTRSQCSFTYLAWH